jgi:flavodoxin
MHPRVLIVVKSLHHQNTAKVAHAIAEVLQADVCSPEDIPASKAGQYDLLGIGSGVYFGAFHRDLRTWLRTLDSCTLSRSAFIFSTSGLSCLYPVWHARSRRQLVSKGYRVIGDFSCRGWDTVGPLLFIGGLNRRHPDAYDLKRAADFARSMLTAWQLPGSAQAPIR